ncbi:MAG: hypothetical protein ACF8SC_06150 [Phycisphaerales bacterium JB037]
MRHQSVVNTRRVGGLLAVLGLGAGLVLATQPERPPVRPMDERGADRRQPMSDALDPRTLSRRLNARLEETDRQIETMTARRDRIAEAVQRLEQGDAPGMVVRDLFRAERALGEGPEFRRGGSPTDRPSGRGPDPDPEQAMRRLAAAWPELAGAIREEMARDPELARQIGQRLRPRLAELMELRETDPELARVRLAEFRAGFEMMLATRDLRAAHLVGEGDAIATAREKLRGTLERTLEARLVAQRFEIRRLEAKLESLREELAEREAERADQIDELMVELDARAAAAEPPQRGRDPRGGR